MIFKETLAETWDGKTPTLIQALRGSKLHVEAMNAFTRTNTYVLHGGNGWSWGTMTPKVIKVRGTGCRMLRHVGDVWILENKANCLLW